MSFAWTPRIALGCALIACGCSSSSADSAMGPPSSGTSSVAAVSFDDGGTLTALPSQSITLGITVVGADTNVTVWLEGDYLDASLSADTVASQGGHASVVLRAPALATTFTIGARIAGAADARMTVAVGAGGFGTINVVPHYSGPRATTAYRASLFVHSTCDDLAKGALKDGVPAVDGTPFSKIVIPDVPAGAHVAVAVRVGHYIRGCSDVDAIVPQRTTDVAVSLYDVPMALDQTDLDVTLTFDPTSYEGDWGPMFDAAAGRASSAFLSGTESYALLDAIRATIALSADKQTFDQARTSGGWDAKVTTWLGAHAPSMHERVQTWMAAAKSDPIGSLLIHLTATSESGNASASPTSFGGIAAADVGITAPSAFAWSADAADAVHLSGNVLLQATPLVTHLANAHAVSAVPQSTDVASALANAIDCTGLMANVVASGVLYGQCGAACAADACRTAIASAWSAACAPSIAADVATLKLTASGIAQVGDAAEPVTFTGAWLGQVSAATGQFATKGTASGKKH